MKRKWIRKILSGLSFTSVLFVFQACYGPPQDFEDDILIEGQVKSMTSGLPIKGIKVSVVDNMQYDFTDNDGQFSFYTEITDSMKIMFEDIDSTKNGQYLSKDTVLTDISEEIFLEIDLDEK